MIGVIIAPMNTTFLFSLYRFVLMSALVVTFVSSTALAQDPRNPTMASGYNDNEREALYARFNDYRRNPNPEQQRFAYPTAKDYLRRWGGETDSETKEVKRFVVEYERAMHGRDLLAFYNAGNFAKVFEMGRAAVKADPDDFNALSLLVEAAHDSAVAGKTGFTAEATDYARRAIKLLEGGKISKPDPFKSVDVARGFLNFALGNFVKDENPVEAAAAYEKAVKSDSPYHLDPAAYHRLGVSILKGEFAQLSNEYNQKYGGQKESAEQAAMFKRIAHLVEQTIDAYARAVALSTKPEQKDAREKILTQLTAIYKNFHNNSDAGLNELIASVLSKPIP
jgi:tetratricopeptide (TPR) repeat protein